MTQGLKSRDVIEAILIKGKTLDPAPFRCIGLMYRYGLKNMLEPEYEKVEIHRNVDAFIVEIPAPNHSIANKVQHPFGNTKGKGLTLSQRQDWNVTKKKFNKERAKEEFLRRDIYNEK